MHYIYPEKAFEPSLNFIAHEVGLQTRPITIVPDGVEANELGRKRVERGSFIDKDGKVTIPTVTADSVTFTEPPVGLLVETVDVTYGNAFGAIVFEGTLWGDWIRWGEEDWNTKYGEDIVKILPGLKFTDHEGHFIDGLVALAGGAQTLSAKTTTKVTKE